MKIIITGGAGFIGCNSAEYFAKEGHQILLVDNLSRKGNEENVEYLIKRYPEQIKLVKGDITEKDFMKTFYDLVKTAGLVLHLAGQVAVTTSLENPEKDFEINARGTLNVLESLRKVKENTGNNPVLIYSSTNKVYGALEDVEVIEKEGEYCYANLGKGIDEFQQLDFHSPYGCSKGAADQYVRDYNRIYGLNTIVIRQSCIYGTRQFGIEDQGWVAWFVIAKRLGKPITVFGDGKQVRDILWVEDLVRAYDLARKNIERTKGQIYNVGGGPENTLSIRRLISLLNADVLNADWRKGDQKICVLDISKAKRDFGWAPSVSPETGVKKLYDWVIENEEEVVRIFGS